MTLSAPIPPFQGFAYVTDGSHEASQSLQNTPFVEQRLDIQYPYLNPLLAAFGAPSGDANEALSLPPFPNSGQIMNGSYSTQSHESTPPPQSLSDNGDGPSGDATPESNDLETPHLNKSILPRRNITLGDDTGFQFVSQGIIIGESQTKPTKEKTSPNANAFRCEHPGCGSGRTFKRKYELQRHMKKHTGKRMFSCPVELCDKTGSGAFYRLDKLTNHLKTAHTDDDRWQCYESGCQAGTMSFDLAKVHMDRHDRTMPKYLDNRTRAFLNAQNTSRQCLFGNCEKWLPIGEMQEHLRGHTGKERLEQISVLKRMGYDARACDVLCPVCSSKSVDHEAFALHMESHGAKGNEHAIAFSSYMKSILPEGRMPDLPRDSWKVWSISRNTSPDLVRVLEHAICPVCSSRIGKLVTERRAKDSFFYVDHYLKALEDCSEIRQVRREILRVYPEFKAHPVFYDIKPIKYQSELYSHDTVELRS
ncbi:hypothetical protein BU16DRAFT_164602 [Lophium mytilinum]|uniref:C2H2-type domain-containing protein n=1 Tax=Lophium mytilinum TaxID=390894 RepID=A0A6A6QE92_9PEZI|nr:hypothetical protein BU16DRAFT_164602 [Lophium mytilinum]